MDYCFMRPCTAAASCTVIVAKDHVTRLLCAHAVPRKGAAVDWVTQQVARDIQRMGHHGRIVLRSDQEPALVDLANHVARQRGEAVTILEHAPKDSQANGMIERGVETVEEITRVHQLALEG